MIDLAAIVATPKSVSVPQAVRKALFAKDWVVYCKPPVCGTDKVVEYLGRYVNRIAISNRRIKSVDADGVSFEYKNYRNDGAVEVMHLSGVEFLRRYCMHILPSGYVRIRHYGYLATASKGRLHSIQRQLNRPLSPRRRPKKTAAQICADKGLTTTSVPIAAQGICTLSRPYRTGPGLRTVHMPPCGNCFLPPSDALTLQPGREHRIHIRRRPS